MRKMMVAAMAVGAAVCAQAVTLKWQTGATDSVYNTDAGGSAKQISDVVAGGSACASASYAIAVTFTQAIASGDNHIVDFGQWDRGHTYANAYGSNQDLGFNYGTVWSQPGVPVSNKEEGSRTFLFTLTWERISDTQTRLVGYIDAQKVMDTTMEGMNGLNAQVYAADYYSVTSTAAYDGVLSADQVAWMAENQTAVLPEPTALALLALGVAGVALRRRLA